MGLFYCFIVFDLENSKHPRDVLKKAQGHSSTKLVLSRDAPCTFFKALPRFFEFSKSFTSPFPPTSSGTSNRWLPGREHPSVKESPSLEPSGKALNTGYRKRQKKSTPSAGAFAAKGVDYYDMRANYKLILCRVKFINSSTNWNWSFCPVARCNQSIKCFLRNIVF